MAMPRDPYTQPNDEAAKFLEEQRRKRTQLLISELGSTPRGREVLEVILDLTQVHHASYHTSPLDTAYAEGRRAVGLQVMSLMRPEDYILLLEESNEREQQRRKQQRAQ